MPRNLIVGAVLGALGPIALAVLGVYALSLTTTSSVPDAAEPRLFEVGVVYDFVWDCSEMIVNAPQSQGVAQVIGCWEEKLIVEHTRKDGWLSVRDKHGKPWTVNPSRAMAITRINDTAPGPQPHALPEPTPPPASLRVQKIPSS